MTFLNAALALGAVAFTVPLVIHILNRNRFQTVEWGAMHLLDSVVRTNQKRFRLDQLILLLVRCAIPVLLALCLARPVLTGFQTLRGDAPVSLMVVLDNSYSMAASADSGASRFEQAVTAASELIAAAGRGSDVAVIQTGGKPTPLFDRPVFDADAVQRRLREQQAEFGASDMTASLEEAITTLNGMSHADRELVVISDFQQSDWAAFGGDGANTLRDRTDAAEIPPTLTLLPVGEDAPGNLSVESLEFPRRPLGPGQSLDVRAVIRNHGNKARDDVRAVLRVDGVEAEVSRVSLAPGGSTQVLFSHLFESPGSHTLEAEVIAEDPLAADNRFRAAVTIWDRIQVLLVDGASSEEPLKGETDFLSIALTPLTLGRARLADLVETERVRPEDLLAEQLNAARLVVLANVPKLSDELLSDLKTYVDGGGAMFITAGDRVDLRWHRDRLFDGGNGLLPLPWGESTGQVAGAGRIERETRPARIASGRFEHPALEFFNDPSRGDLSGAVIRRWSRLEFPTAERNETAERSDVLVAARLDTGDPLFVERRFGDGVVLQMATSVDADWTDLPLQPFFVPLMQQITTTLATRISPPRNIACGEPAVAILDATDGAAPEPAAVVFQTPTGERLPVPVTARGTLSVARFENTQRPGIYTMTGVTTQEELHYVAEAPRDESELGMMDAAEIDNLAERLGATRVDSAADYLARDRLSRHGREIWKWLLAGLLALLFLEVVLQQRFLRAPA